MKPRIPRIVPLALLALGVSALAVDDSVTSVQVRATAHFDSGRTAILPADQQRLLAEVARMKDVAWQSITAVGHADSIGGTEMNERLSERRADAVRAYLVGKGIDHAMIHTDARGELEPVGDNATADGRRQNRRTELLFEGVRAAQR